MKNLPPKDPVPPLPQTLPASLRAMVERLLAKDPAARYTDATTLLTALTDALTAPTIPAQVRAESSPQSPITSHQSPLSFDWITIPAGEFLMGSDKSKDPLTFDNETSQHRLVLPEYRIARIPVTVTQFEVFVKATGYRTTAEEEGSAYGYTGEKWGEIKGANWRQPRGPQSDVRNKADHPVTCVSWLDAIAFCEWAGVRLPSEAEWEKAARGTDGRIYPWGNNAPDDRLCNFNMNVKDTTPVGRYPKGVGPYGLLDAAGNVWEWTRSILRSYPYDAKDGREDLRSSAESRVLRGASFNSDEWDVRCAGRGGLSEDVRLNDIGFRVVAPGFWPLAL